MDKNTHETYVSLEVAKQLKKAGFNWPCHSDYQNDIFKEFSISNQDRDVLIMDFNSAPDYMNQFSAPTLEVARKWFREVHNAEVSVDSTKIGNELVWVSELWDINKGEYIGMVNKEYDTYEDALEAGIQLFMDKKFKEIV